MAFNIQHELTWIHFNEDSPVILYIMHLSNLFPAALFSDIIQIEFSRINDTARNASIINVLPDKYFTFEGTSTKKKKRENLWLYFVNI